LKRALLLLVALALLALGVRWLVRAFASDESRVRWRIEAMRDGFNDSELAPVVDALSPRFVETESGADVDKTEQALIYLYFQEIDAKSKSFALVAECEPRDWEIAVLPGTAASAEELDAQTSDAKAAPDSDRASTPVSARTPAKRATARGECRLLRKDGDARKLLWRADAELELEEDETDGWLVTRATLLTLEGARRAH
jgi:hypothetical protein